VFVDVLRNSYGQTAVVSYSLRARPSAPVAAPLSWDEVKRADFAADGFNLKNIFNRLKATGDPWQETALKANALEAALRSYHIGDGFSGE